MPWCPKCKNEYREGIKVCADCGCELVEEEQFEGQVPFTFGDEEELKSLKKYLEFNKLKGIDVRFDEKDQVYVLYVLEEDRGKVSMLAKTFMEQKAVEREMQQAEPYEAEPDEEESTEEAYDSEAEPSEDADKKVASVRPTVYQNSSERAEENRSSAWALLVVGLAGIVVVILGIMDIIPLHVGNPYMFYGVMSAIFILFIVMGFVSMKNAKLFAKKAESENTLRDAMVKWYQENLDAASLDAEWKSSEDKEADIQQEMLYFKRSELLKDKFNHQFVNLDQAFLERFIDEEVYDALFSGESDEN